MSIRKFLHINKAALFIILLAGYLCYGSDVALHQAQPARNIQQPQPTVWQRFTQHPIAAHAPTVALGGLGAKLFQYGAATDSYWYKAASLAPLMAAPLWATYVQSAQRAAERPKLQKEGEENVEINPRTSRWRLAWPTLGAAGLVAALNVYNNNSLLRSLLWSAGAAAIPSCYAGTSATEELRGDLEYAGSVMNWALKTDFKKDVTNTESIRWALGVLNSPGIYESYQKDYISRLNRDLLVNQADNLLKIEAALLKDAQSDDAKNIKLLNDMGKKMHYIFSSVIEAKTEISGELFIQKHTHSNLRNTAYEKIEDALGELQKNNAQFELVDLFVKYPKEMNDVLEEFNTRTKLYQDVGTKFPNDYSRESIAQFMQESQIKARTQAILTDAFNIGMNAQQIKGLLENVLGGITWTQILDDLVLLRNELTGHDTQQDKIMKFNELATEISLKARE